jgi:N-acetylglucosaminyl-diphospho-decaprenol L-rhamnosyltransferase
MKANVAIIIVSYNSGKHISACLESVYNQKVSVRQQVIVVDNASCDDTAEIVRTNFPNATLLQPGVNLGFAAGVNYGASHADAEFILLLNPDTVILNHAIDVIIDFATKHPGDRIYGGRTLKPDGSLEPSSCWGQPTLWSMAMFGLGLTTLLPKNRWFDPESLGHWKRDSVREVGVITGCFLMCPKPIWDALGGMDERYFMYGEDVDFAMRARCAGIRLMICPGAELVHEIGQCSESSVHKSLLLYRGKACLVRTHWKSPKKWIALFLLAAGTGLRAGISSLGAFVSLNRDTGRWQALWRDRHEWIIGYPREECPPDTGCHTVPH